MSIITKGYGSPNRIITKGFFVPAVVIRPVYHGAAVLLTKKASTGSYTYNIIDDTDTPLVSYNFDWITSANTGYGTNYKYFSPGFGGEAAWWQWSHNNILPGIQDVYVSWVTNPNRPTDVKYEIIIPGQAVKTYRVNQRVAPEGPKFGSGRFQKLDNVFVPGTSLAVRVYGDVNFYSIADASLVMKTNYNIKPVYSGFANFSRHPSIRVVGGVPHYSGFANLVKNKTLKAVGNNIVPVYSGNSKLSVPVYISGVFRSFRPIYSGNATLEINRVEYIGDAVRILPVYSGSAPLEINHVIVSVGKDIFKGFIYKSVLYVTNKTVHVNYMKMNTITNVHII